MRRNLGPARFPANLRDIRPDGAEMFLWCQVLYPAGVYEGGEHMQIQIFQIKVNHERREVDQETVHQLADSISKLGLLNPITVDQEYTLIAGLHRLEAVKLLGWAEIECTVSSLEGLLAQLAEIDENFVLTTLDAIERGKLILKLN